MKKILVTGSGGIGGVNFVRALRATDEEFFLVGTDFNQYYLEFPDVNLRVNTPRHSDSTFLPQIKKIVNEYQIDFVHPQPSSEALVISQDNELKSKTFLPSSTVIANDKLTPHEYLFSEDQSRYLIEVNEKNKNEVYKTLEKNSIFYEMLGKTQKDSLVLNKDFDIKLDELRKLNSSWFKKYFKEN